MCVSVMCVCVCVGVGRQAGVVGVEGLRQAEGSVKVKMCATQTYVKAACIRGKKKASHSYTEEEEEDVCLAMRWREEGGPLSHTHKAYSMAGKEMAVTHMARCVECNTCHCTMSAYKKKYTGVAYSTHNIYRRRKYTHT